MNYRLKLMATALIFGLAFSQISAATDSSSLALLKEKFGELNAKVNDVITAMAKTKKLNLKTDDVQEEFDDFLGHIKALAKSAKSDEDKRVVSTSIALLKNVIGDINYKLQELEQKLQ